MAYEIPIGYKVPLNFKGVTYSPPLGHRVGLEFVPNDGPAGEEQYVFPSSWESHAFGSVYARRKSELLFASGWNASAFGTHQAFNLRKYILAGGIASKLAFGALTIYNRD